MKFWDSSGLVALLVSEPASDGLKQIIAEDPAVAVWWGSRAEAVAALSRMSRDGRLSLKGCDQAVAGIAALIQDALVIDPDAALLDRAIGLLRRRALTASDGFQLAAARTWADGREQPDFVCLDRRLRAAAHAEGLAILPC